MSALEEIQTKLKAPKGQFNNFGKYKYRSCEDILEAVKPHLERTHSILTLSDSVEAVLGRVYIKATVTLQEGDMSWTVTAFAREAETKKGMDDSQITGTASSYARKYALNGLFLIDDTKDADTMDNSDPMHDKNYYLNNPRVDEKSKEYIRNHELTEDMKYRLDEMITGRAGA